MENFYAAAAQVYDWFTLTTLPLDASDSRTENDQTYYRVDCQSFPMPTLHVSSPCRQHYGLHRYPGDPLLPGGPSVPWWSPIFSPELAASLFSLSPDHYRGL